LNRSIEDGFAIVSVDNFTRDELPPNNKSIEHDKQKDKKVSVDVGIQYDLLLKLQ
jgi:hypothetical protein